MKIAFRSPNFNCQVSIKDDPVKNKMWVLCYAADEHQARAALADLNFRIHNVQPYDFEAGWRQEAWVELKAAATKILPLIAVGQKPIFQGKSPDYQFNDKLWSKLKVHLVILFHNKCAYCEKVIGNDVRVCEVEHYRPKSAVTEDPKHSGYWWLAYEPTNYLPSCRICNGLIKKNHFPLMEGSQRVQRLSDDLLNVAGPVDLCRDLAREQPVIINPYQDDPEDFFYYHTVCKSADRNAVKCPGAAIPKNKRGEKAIQAQKLNTSMRLKDRKKVQENVRNSLKQLLQAEDLPALQKLFQDIREGNQEFYTAAKAEVQAYYEKMHLQDDPFS